MPICAGIDDRFRGHERCRVKPGNISKSHNFKYSKLHSPIDSYIQGSCIIITFHLHTHTRTFSRTQTQTPTQTQTQTHTHREHIQTDRQTCTHAQMVARGGKQVPKRSRKRTPTFQPCTRGDGYQPCTEALGGSFRARKERFWLGLGVLGLSRR